MLSHPAPSGNGNAARLKNPTPPTPPRIPLLFEMMSGSDICPWPIIARNPHGSEIEVGSDTLTLDQAAEKSGISREKLRALFLLIHGDWINPAAFEEGGDDAE